MSVYPLTWNRCYYSLQVRGTSSAVKFKAFCVRLKYVKLFSEIKALINWVELLFPQVYIPVSRHQFEQFFQPFSGKMRPDIKAWNCMKALNQLTICLQTEKNRLQGTKLSAVWTKNRTRRCEFVSVRQSWRRNAVWPSFRTNINTRTHMVRPLLTHTTDQTITGWVDVVPCRGPFGGLWVSTWHTQYNHTWGWRWLPINSFHFSSSRVETWSPDSQLLNPLRFITGTIYHSLNLILMPTPLLHLCNFNVFSWHRCVIHRKSPSFPFNVFEYTHSKDLHLRRQL